MRLKYKLILSLSLVLVVFVANVGIAQAALTPEECKRAWRLTCPIIPTECTDNIPDSEDPNKAVCDFMDMATTMVHIAQWILAVVGAVSFGYFVYGGFTLLTAAGNTARVDQGRRILIGTVIGLFIVLGAFQLVGWVGNVFSGDPKALPKGYDLFLDTGPNQCINDGDRCTIDGEDVYACGTDKTCSGVSLCAYWAPKSNNPYNLTTGHKCSPRMINGIEICQDGSKVEELCPSGDTNVCCLPEI